ncbi:MAG: pilus assembly protein N-terminal domain-containing protein [Deltaproteobacteria bacterium]|nr:pilus assembly protein N-terminal domain-containing protein [Deltaproteobacteria bacterium]
MKKAATLIPLIFVLSTASIPKAQGFAGAADELTLIVGQQHVLDADNIDSFSESTRGVVEIKIPRTGRQLVITAIQPGNTSILLLDQAGNQRQLAISVFARDPARLMDELKELIGPASGLNYRQLGARVVVDGTVGSESELERVSRILAMYPEQAISLVRIGQAVLPRTNIRLDLTFVEFHTSNTLGGGLKWPENMGTGELQFSYDLISGAPAASYKVVDQMVPSLHAAQTHGIAKIRKQAHLMTTNGNSATYESGGEINIPVVGAMTAELAKVNYGCTLTVLPHIDEEAKLIDLEVEAEVSELRETNQSVPGRTISKVKTLVHLGLGQSIVLSGLDSHTESKNKKGLPFLSRIPIIGMLFGTHHKHNEKVSGIIAITPVVINNVDRDSRRQIDEALKKFKKFKG